MSADRSFFRFQERVSGILLAWGLASVAAGLPALRSRSPLVRHAGMQAIGWGAIDAVLGLFGQRGARAKIRSGADDAAHQARRFRLIVLANAFLDVGYIAGGWALVRGARGRSDRVGAGLGIMAQGLFLLIFDGALAWLTGRYLDDGR